MKRNLAVLHIHHQPDHRIGAHTFISFLAYAPQVTVNTRLNRCTKGITPRNAREKFETLQMRNVQCAFPTIEEREIIMTRASTERKTANSVIKTSRRCSVNSQCGSSSTTVHISLRWECIIPLDRSRL